MIHRNLHLTPESSDFIRSRIESGRYENVQELMRAALRALQREESRSEGQCPAVGNAERDAYRKLWEASDLFQRMQR
jgi:putative addiction module CopG family antidote